MRVLFYSMKNFEAPYLASGNPGIEVQSTEECLSEKTAVLAEGYQAISIFSGDDASAPVIEILKNKGVKFIAVRAAGFDNVDLDAANTAGIHVANVPEYSPNSIAEHAIALMLSLDRKIVPANQQMRSQNYSVNNLVGFDLYKKKVGIIGTGRIGSTVAKILHGFGCTLFAYDIVNNNRLEKENNVLYTGLHTLCSLCDIVTIHVPLNANTKYLIDKKLIQMMKPGVMLINTSRGAVVNTKDVLDGLVKGQIGYFGADVYEYEKGLFFYDHSGKPAKDLLLQRLVNLPNVLITPHQAFATKEALKNIAETTFYNLSVWDHGCASENELTSLNKPVVYKL